jgi:hypothetical protein
VSAKLGTKAEIALMNLRLDEIRKLTLEWLTTNYVLVTKTPLNRINSGLKSLSTLCFEKVGVKDYRTIAKAFDTTNAKELLKVLKDLSENVCRAKDE